MLTKHHNVYLAIFHRFHPLSRHIVSFAVNSFCMPFHDIKKFIAIHRIFPQPTKEKNVTSEIFSFKSVDAEEIQFDIISSPTFV